MKRLIITDASISLGLGVWLAAALLLPFHLGASGVGYAALLGYTLLAGLLLSLGDRLAGNSFTLGPGDFVATALMRGLGLAIPAALLFALGQIAAPAAEDWEDEVCALGGYAEMPDGGDSSSDRMIDGTADCMPAQ
jgi:hypothetical protein